MDSSTLGQSVRRIEDVRFLTGRGRFVDDVKQVQVVVLCSVVAMFLESN